LVKAGQLAVVVAVVVSGMVGSPAFVVVLTVVAAAVVMFAAPRSNTNVLIRTSSTVNCECGSADDDVAIASAKRGSELSAGPTVKSAESPAQFPPVGTRLPEMLALTRYRPSTSGKIVEGTWYVTREQYQSVAHPVV
jgi:hypothetical protein